MSDSGSRSAQGGDSARSKWWSLGTIAGVCTVLALLVATGQWAFPRAAPDVLAECRKNHPDADGKPVLQERKAEADIFVVKGCKDPGLPGVAKDGLWEARLASYGADPDYQSPFWAVEAFTTDCPALGLELRFSKMGNTDSYRIVVPDESTVSGNSDRPEDIYGLTVPAQAPEDVKAMAGEALLVFHGSSTSLQAVSCEDLAAVTPRPERQ